MFVRSLSLSLSGCTMMCYFISHIVTCFAVLYTGDTYVTRRRWQMTSCCWPMRSAVCCSVKRWVMTEHDMLRHLTESKRCIILFLWPFPHLSTACASDILLQQSQRCCWVNFLFGYRPCSMTSSQFLLIFANIPRQDFKACFDLHCVVRFHAMTRRKMCHTALPVPLNRDSSLISSSALKMGRRLVVVISLWCSGRLLVVVPVVWGVCFCVLLIDPC